MNRTNAHVAKELNNCGDQPSYSMNNPNQVQLKLEVISLTQHVVKLCRKYQMGGIARLVCLMLWELRPRMKWRDQSSCQHLTAFLVVISLYSSGTNWWNLYFRRLSYVLTMFTCFRILSPNILIIRKPPCYI